MTTLLPLAISDALRDWLDLGLRWLHVIAAMAWIGTSFYFVLLDQSLRSPKEEILQVLRDRIGNPTDAELETALDELVAIAGDRWVRT